MRRRPERCVVGVTRIWRRAGVRHELSVKNYGLSAARRPGSWGRAHGGRRELSEEPSRRALTASRCVRLGVCETGAARDQQVWAHGDPPRTVNTNVAHYTYSSPLLREAGGSAISVIKTLRLLVADLAHKTAQNCTKMPARRCPRMLALLLAAAAPAAVSSEAAHEWAGPQPASKGNKPTRARPRPHRSRDAGIFELNAGETYTWRAQKVRAGVPPRRARSARPPRRSPATSGRAFST